MSARTAATQVVTVHECARSRRDRSTISAQNTPASDAPQSASGAVTLSYYDNDLARTITQAGTTTTFTLNAIDPRVTETITNTSGSTDTVRHYTDTSDNPTWVTQGITTQRYAELIGSDLTLTVNQSGAADLTQSSILTGRGDDRGRPRRQRRRGDRWLEQLRRVRQCNGRLV